MNRMLSTGVYVDNNGDGWMVTTKWQSNDIKTQDANIGKMGGEIFLGYREDDLPTAIDKVLNCMKFMSIKRCDEMELFDFAIYFVNAHKMKKKEKQHYILIAEEEAKKRK